VSLAAIQETLEALGSVDRSWATHFLSKNAPHPLEGGFLEKKSRAPKNHKIALFCPTLIEKQTISQIPMFGDTLFFIFAFSSFHKLIIQVEK
jgi:hypothetical protein